MLSHSTQLCKAPTTQPASDHAVCCMLLQFAAAALRGHLDHCTGSYSLNISLRVWASSFKTTSLNSLIGGCTNAALISPPVTPHALMCSGSDRSDSSRCSCPGSIGSRDSRMVVLPLVAATHSCAVQHGTQQYYNRPHIFKVWYY
jgi:hypothetical protein